MTVRFSSGTLSGIGKCHVQVEFSHMDNRDEFAINDGGYAVVCSSLKSDTAKPTPAPQLSPLDVVALV